MDFLLSYYETLSALEGKIPMPRLLKKELLTGFKTRKEVIQYIVSQKDRTGAPYLDSSEDINVYVAAVGHVVIETPRMVPQIVPKNKVSDVSLDSRKNVENQKNLAQSESGVAAATATPAPFQKDGFRQFVKITMEFARIAFHPEKNEFEGHYTYIPFYSVELIEDALKTLPIKSFMDLGSGVPIISAYLSLKYGLHTGAVELRQDIYDKCQADFVNCVDFYCTNMFNCTSEFLDPWDLIYMYVPMYDHRLMAKFVQHLVANTRKGQFLLLAGFSDDLVSAITEDKRFIRCQEYDLTLRVYKRIL